jgi:hypothetical protein
VLGERAAATGPHDGSSGSGGAAVPAERMLDLGMILRAEHMLDLAQHGRGESCCYSATMVSMVTLTSVLRADGTDLAQTLGEYGVC